MIIDFKNDRAFFEGVPIQDIIDVCETPFYLYSQRKIIKNYSILKKKLSSDIFFSIKSNSNQGILKLMNNLGSGADCVSAGEVTRSLEAGFSPDKIIYEGVGTSKHDLEYAVKQNIKLINIESIDEIHLINKIGINNQKTINIGVRLNIDIDGKTIEKISTGKRTDKFGVSVSSLNEVILLAKSLKKINLIGISCHIGSQIHDILIFEKVFRKMKEIAESISLENIDLNYIDLGGGFAVNYEKEDDDLDLDSIGKLKQSIFKDTPYKISFEPGRYLIAKAGIIVTKILTSKNNGGINFLIADSGMHTLIRPAMYNAFHRVEAINKNNEKIMKYTIAGPICESSDIIRKDINLPMQSIDDYIIIHDTGAYGATMSSDYNSRGRPSEVLVFKDNFSVIRNKEKISDTIKRDNIPDWLKN